MKAIVQHEYGAPRDVLRLAEVAMPAVGAGDVLVSVRASSANPWDWHFIRGEPVLLADLHRGNAGAAAGVLADAGFNVSTATVDVSSRTSVRALAGTAAALGDWGRWKAVHDRRR